MQSGNIRMTVENIKKAEIDFILDLVIRISKIATYLEMKRFRASMSNEERKTTTESYKSVFEKLSIQGSLISMDILIAIPVDLRK